MWALAKARRKTKQKQNKKEKKKQKQKQSETYSQTPTQGDMVFKDPSKYIFTAGTSTNANISLK